MRTPRPVAMRPPNPGSSVLAAFFLFLAVACGGGSPTSPSGGATTPPAPVNNAPTISSMTASGSGYRTARVTATFADGDGSIASGALDWGDGSTTALSNVATSVNSTHRYDRAQAYAVTLSVFDDDGASAQSTKSVSITVPPEACVGIEIIEVCAMTTSDFKNANLAARAGDITLARLTLSDGNPSAAMPPAGGFGRLTVSHNFTTGRTTISGEVCPVPFLVCRAVGSVPIQF